jgi:endonuclease/exonuclease/phosphatase family metal-dependent hydrolase
MKLRSRSLLLAFFLLATGGTFADTGYIGKTSEQFVSSVLTTNTITVATLNVAHGRKDGINQILQSGDRARRNLVEVADLLSRINADVVALQEADGPSRWSGNFNHVTVVGEAAKYPHQVHGLHAKRRLYEFGTAVLSRTAFSTSFTHDFEPTPPTTTKGFSVGSIEWNPSDALEEPLLIHAVSVHLDFSRSDVREAQVRELEALLKTMSGPLIVMGDFNADAEDDDSPVRHLVDRLHLRLYESDSEDLSTYGSSDRLDWILISPELEFVRHVTWPDVVSDHQAVAAQLALVEK